MGERAVKAEHGKRGAWVWRGHLRVSPAGGRDYILQEAGTSYQGQHDFLTALLWSCFWFCFPDEATGRKRSHVWPLLPQSEPVCPGVSLKNVTLSTSSLSSLLYSQAISRARSPDLGISHLL